MLCSESFILPFLAVYIGILLIIFPCAKYIFHFWFKIFERSFNINQELVDKDNKAVCLTFSGFIMAIGLVVWGVLSEQDDKEVCR